MNNPTQDEEMKHILGHCLHPRDDEKDCIYWQIIGVAYRSKDEDKNRKIFENMQEAALHRLILKERQKELQDLSMGSGEYHDTEYCVPNRHIIERIRELDLQIESPNDPS